MLSVLSHQYISMTPVDCTCRCSGSWHLLDLHSRALRLLARGKPGQICKAEHCSSKHAMDKWLTTRATSFLLQSLADLALGPHGEDDHSMSCTHPSMTVLPCCCLCQVDLIRLAQSSNCCLSQVHLIQFAQSSKSASYMPAVLN